MLLPPLTHLLSQQKFAPEQEAENLLVFLQQKTVEKTSHIKKPKKYWCVTCVFMCEHMSTCEFTCTLLKMGCSETPLGHYALLVIKSNL